MKRPRPSPLAILRGHTTPLTCTKFISVNNEPTNKYLLSGDETGTLRLWDTTLEGTILQTTPSTSPILSILDNDNDPNKIITHQKNGYVTTIDLNHDVSIADEISWSIHNKSTKKSDNIQESFCRMIKVSSSANLYAAPSTKDNDICILLVDNRLSNNEKFVLKLSMNDSTTGFLLSLSNLSNDKTVAAGYEDGTISTFDIRNPSAPTKRILSNDKKSAVLSLCSSPFGNVIAAAGAFNSIVSVADYDSNDGNMNIIANSELRNEGISDLKWSLNGKYIISAGWDSVMRVYDGRRTKNKLLRNIVSLKWHQGTVSSLCFDQDTSTIASGGKDTTIALWDTQFSYI